MRIFGSTFWALENGKVEHILKNLTKLILLKLAAIEWTQQNNIVKENQYNKDLHKSQVRPSGTIY